MLIVLSEKLFLICMFPLISRLKTRPAWITEYHQTLRVAIYLEVSTLLHDSFF